MRRHIIRVRRVRVHVPAGSVRQGADCVHIKENQRGHNKETAMKNVMKQYHFPPTRILCYDLTALTKAGDSNTIERRLYGKLMKGRICQTR